MLFKRNALAIKCTVSSLKAKGSLCCHFMAT